MTVYEVDLNRLVIKLTQKNGGSYVYTYDPVHRLTGITTPLGLTFLIDSGGYDRAAFELGRIVGNAAAIAAIFGMFFAGGGAISGAFMGGAMALTLGAAGAATLEIAAGATVVAAKGNSIAEALNSLMSEMSGASNSGGKGTEEEGESETVINNQGKEIDITPNKNHTTTSNNPGYKGEPNSSIDILDKDGNIITRRWFDENGKAIRDVDMTNHGNPKQHPEWPHEHFWQYGSDGKPIGR